MTQKTNWEMMQKLLAEARQEADAALDGARSATHDIRVIAHLLYALVLAVLALVHATAYSGE